MFDLISHIRARILGDLTKVVFSSVTVVLSPLFYHRRIVTSALPLLHRRTTAGARLEKIPRPAGPEENRENILAPESILRLPEEAASFTPQ